MDREMDKTHFKNDEVRNEWKDIRVTLQDVLIDMKGYCVMNGMPFLITDLTSTMAEDKKLHRTSATHRERRAADLRCIYWPEWFIVQFIDHFETKYKAIAALSGKPLKSNLIERHVGTADHIHVQLRGTVK